MNPISVRKLYLRRKELLPLPWAYPTLLKYVCKNYSHIFKPILSNSKSRSGRRYLVTEENIKEFKRQFLSGELKDNSN